MVLSTIEVKWLLQPTPSIHHLVWSRMPTPHICSQDLNLGSFGKPQLSVRWALRPTRWQRGVSPMERNPLWACTANKLKKKVCAEMCYRRAGGMIQTTKCRNYCKMGYNVSSAKRKIAPPASPHDHHRLPRTKYLHALWCSEIHEHLQITAWYMFQAVPEFFPGFPGVSRSLPIFQEFSRKRRSHV